MAIPAFAIAVFTTSLQGQVSDGERVWYTLANRVPIFRSPSVNAPVVGIIPTPDAICAVRPVGRFLEVRRFADGGRTLVGFIERMRVDISPLFPSGARRIEDVCVAPPTIEATVSTAPAGDSAAPPPPPPPPPSPVRARIEEQRRLLAFAQEWYFSRQGAYTRTLVDLAQVFAAAPGVAIALMGADAQSWSARITVGGTTCDVSHSVATGSVTECR